MVFIDVSDGLQGPAVLTGPTLGDRIRYQTQNVLFPLEPSTESFTLK